MKNSIPVDGTHRSAIKFVPDNATIVQMEGEPNSKQSDTNADDWSRSQLAKIRNAEASSDNNIDDHNSNQHNVRSLRIEYNSYDDDQYCKIDEF